ncbi:MAG: hypothetical protein WCB68_16440 [Pyrinomonadaceae bacterium]
MRRRIYSSGTILANAFTSLALVLLFSLATPAQSASRRNAGATPEQRTASYLESIRKSPPQMLAFMLKMPKGGDLHNHLSGSIYAESYIEWAAEKNRCVNTTTMVVSLPPCDQPGQLQASAALTNPVLYRQWIDAWSMRFSQLSGQSGHDHFFDAFGKFSVATYDMNGKMLADTAKRAARGHVLYLELMLTPDNGKSSDIGKGVDWDGSLPSMLEKLKSKGIADAVPIGIKTVHDAEEEKDTLLKCNTPEAEAGCSVTIRYISQVSRGAPLSQVFAQMITGFALANDPNSKVVALNLVQAEDGFTAMKYFKKHMEMLGFLHSLYPNVNITLHAGELAPGIVPPEGLTFHISDSVRVGHARRIGHGVDIMHEDNPYDLLRELARLDVLIEICLTSNDVILGISKEQHPLATYMKYDVPVALATDDEGVSRSEISREFLKAAEEQGLGYIQLKTMARNSLQYSFLPGASLWSDARKFVPVAECAKDIPGMKTASDACSQFKAGSKKAELQWKLEEEFREFESLY